MKITVTTDDGLVLDVIRPKEIGDLNRPDARAELAQRLATSYRREPAIQYLEEEKREALLSRGA